MVYEENTLSLTRVRALPVRCTRIVMCILWIVESPRTRVLHSIAYHFMENPQRLFWIVWQQKKSNIIIPCHQTWAPQHFNLNNMRACSISSLHLRCIVPMRSDCQPMCISFPSLNHPARKQFKIDL